MSIEDLAKKHQEILDEREAITLRGKVLDSELFIVDLLLKILQQAESKHKEKLKSGKPIDVEDYTTIEHGEEIKISWWSSCEQHKNYHFNEERETMTKRRSILKQICDSLGIGYKISERDIYPFGEDHSLKIEFEFYVLDSLIASMQNIDITEIAKILELNNR